MDIMECQRPGSAELRVPSRPEYQHSAGWTPVVWSLCVWCSLRRVAAADSEILKTVGVHQTKRAHRAWSSGGAGCLACFWHQFYNIDIVGPLTRLMLTYIHLFMK